jgi:hypothetical protein
MANAKKVKDVQPIRICFLINVANFKGCLGFDYCLIWKNPTPLKRRYNWPVPLNKLFLLFKVE